MSRPEMNLLKFLNNSFADTVFMIGKEYRSVRFDLSLYLDTGLYSVTRSNNMFSTSTGEAIVVESMDGKTIFRRKDLEDEKGIRCECIPKYSQNLINNKRTRFVHYTSSNRFEGNRQTFSYAYMSAIKTVKEIYNSDFFYEVYPDIVQIDDGTQVRSLMVDYMPTDELVKQITNDEKPTHFLLELLSILSVYFLMKTFELNKIELSHEDVNCTTIMKNLQVHQYKFSDKEIEAYKTFLYLLSTSQVCKKNGDHWVGHVTSQRKFHYAIDYRPISYQRQAIDDQQIKLDVNLKNIEEDICIMLGYHNVIEKPYSSRYPDIVLNYLIQYYIDPNIVYSQAYNQCVNDLNVALEACSDLNEVLALQKISTDIPRDDNEALAPALAKSYVRSLYKDYPQKYYNYLNRCQNELFISKRILKPEMNSDMDCYTKVVVRLYEGVNGLERGNIDLPITEELYRKEMQKEEESDDYISSFDYVNFGYSLFPISDTYYNNYQQAVNGLPHSEINNQCMPSDPEHVFILNYSPACHKLAFASSEVCGELRSLSVQSGLKLSEYELLVAYCEDMIKAVENTTLYNTIDLNKFGITKALGSYADNLQSIFEETGSISLQDYINHNKARQLKEEIEENPTLLRLSKFIKYSDIEYTIEANLFALNHLDSVIREAVDYAYSVKEEANYIDGYLITSDIKDMYRVLTEVSRQLLAFVSDYMKQLGNHFYPTVKDYAKQFNDDNSDMPEYFLSFKDQPFFDLHDIYDKVISDNSGKTVEILKQLLDYINRDTEMLQIKDLSLTTHVERKCIISKEASSYINTSGAMDVEDLWEPHKLKITVSIPYARYKRLKAFDEGIDKGYNIEHYVSIINEEITSGVVHW